VQSIIKELRGEKIDIIEWSDEPSIFAANALSPAKVSQVRITDIDHRKMEVIVPEDQLSLAIGKFGQNVRLATKLVGWNIDIVSEEVLKMEIARQMSDMVASGAAVPLTALQGVTANQAETLDEKGISDVDALAAASVDDLVDMLDISLDEAERIIGSAKSIVEARNAPAGEEAEESSSASFEEIAETIEAGETDETFESETAENTGDEASEDAAESPEEESYPDEPSLEDNRGITDTTSELLAEQFTGDVEGYVTPEGEKEESENNSDEEK
jgi:N utilization substance protein A